MKYVTCIVCCAHMDASALCVLAKCSSPQTPTWRCHVVVCDVSVHFVPHRVCCTCVLRPLSSPTTSAQKETNTKDTTTIHKRTMQERHADSTQDENPRKRRQLSADEVLEEAARNGDTTAVRAGLEELNPNRKAVAFARGAAHETCRGNHDECLALLLPYVETTQMGFGILLSECVHADHVACTEVLLQHWKSVCNKVSFVPHEAKHSSGQSASLCPAMWSNPAVCRVLIDAGADLHTKNEKQESPLHYACESGALDVVKMLVEAGAGVRDTNDEGWTCLHVAVQFGHTETVRYLMGLPFVDMNHRDSDNRTALCVAVDEERTDIVQVLIDAGADIDTQNNEGWSPLHTACEYGGLDIVKMLVRAGAGVRATDNLGWTCLAHAARYGHTETVRYLAGLPEVELNYRYHDNDTALHLAVDENRTDVVQVLIDAGADIDIKNYAGRSPLHCACASGALDLVKMLVRGGAGVRARNVKGRTCLHLAAELGHTETVRYLVGLPEVELNHRDTEKNYTALQYAVEEKHTEVAQVLIHALYVVFGV